MDSFVRRRVFFPWRSILPRDEWLLWSWIWAGALLRTRESRRNRSSMGTGLHQLVRELKLEPRQHVNVCSTWWAGSTGDLLTRVQVSVNFQHHEMALGFFSLSFQSVVISVLWSVLWIFSPCVLWFPLLAYMEIALIINDEINTGLNSIKLRAFEMGMSSRVPGHDKQQKTRKRTHRRSPSNRVPLVKNADSFPSFSLAEAPHASEGKLLWLCRFLDLQQFVSSRTWESACWAQLSLELAPGQQYRRWRWQQGEGMKDSGIQMEAAGGGCFLIF